MRIILLTQKEPFYLAEQIQYLLEILPDNSKIVACVLDEAVPFGAKESLLKKSYKTLKIFGLGFFLFYMFQFLRSKLSTKKDVEKVLQNNQIALINLNNNINHPDSVNLIKSYEPDVLVSILGSQIYRDPIINLAPYGCLNLHSALLPKYRGLMPTFWVLRNNEKFTGVSVHFVDKGIDSGDILVQKKIEIGSRTQKELIEVTKRLGMEAIVESIKKLQNANFKLIENDPAQKSYFGFPTREDVKVFKKAGKKFF